MAKSPTCPCHTKTCQGHWCPNTGRVIILDIKIYLKKVSAPNIKTPSSRILWFNKEEEKEPSHLADQKVEPMLGLLKASHQSSLGYYSLQLKG